MGNAKKHLFWPAQFSNPHCTICPTQYIDIWTHVLLNCTQHHLHALRTQHHNKAVWKIKKLLSHPTTRSFIFMNAGTFNANPLGNTARDSLLPCSYFTLPCQCNARFKPDILYIHGLPYQTLHPTDPNPQLIIQFIEFTYTNDCFFEERIKQKIDKYTPLVQSI